MFTAARMLDAATFDFLAKACATVGFGLFAWPMIQRLRGLDTDDSAKRRAQLRSGPWWIGFFLICLALLFQRLAAQQAGV
jgi:hypothetical protein